MKEFFDDLNRLAKPTMQGILEKDYHLHRLLKKISENDFLTQNLVFKGGTCLIKAYTGYFRFSEDIDFTWKDTGLWQGKTNSQTRRHCSKKIDEVIRNLLPIADELELDFKGDKSDMGEVIIGAGGRMPRFYLGYYSHLLNMPAKIKMEINFVDRTLYPFHKKDLQSYIGDFESGKLQVLYKNQWKEYTDPISICCYDPREIYIEKCRAALTRIRYKLRDIIDIHILEKQYRYTIPYFRKEILDKTRFMLDLYEKYREKIETKSLPEIGDIPSEELKLLTSYPSEGLEKNIQRIHLQLQKLQKELT